MIDNDSCVRVSEVIKKLATKINDNSENEINSTN